MVAMGSGIFVGAYFTQKRLDDEYEVRLKAELIKSKEYYTRLTKKEDYATPSDVLEKVAPQINSEILEEERYVAFPSDPSAEEEAVEEDEELDDDSARHSVFDYRREIPKRAGKKAFVVSFDEFKENPKDYDQRTLTYYEKDDVLVDERDTPIDDIDLTIGLEALDQFGNGSNDPNIVYVVNEWAAMGFEIIRERESYEETVLGSMKHSSDRRRPRKFRIDDD
jgi:hypothetical protein